MREALPSWLAVSRDRVLASDPGLGRLRQAFAATVSLGTALGVEYLVARLSHAGPQATLIAMLLGAMVAMMGANALAGPERWGNVKVAVFFPVAIGLGMGVGTVTSTSTDLMLAVFVVVMFAAVFVRRFGLPFFFYGFMAWMGYFFASFLKTTLSVLPNLLLAVVIGSAWVLLLSVTVLRTDPRRVLAATVRSFSGRTRRVARDCAELLELGPRQHDRRARALRRLGARQAGMAEAALMAEGWSDDPDALAPGWSGPALRRRLLETQHAVERLAAASTGLAEAEDEVRGPARELLEHLGRREDLAARAAADRVAALASATVDPAVAGHVRHLAAAAVELLELQASAAEPPELAPVDDFAPTTGLFFGNLPGSPAVARDVAARGLSWNPLARLDLTTRQAVQVAVAGALAIVLGRALDPVRYYWAVIAAFVMFTGTGTRSESFLKGVNRVLGTLLGLVAAIGFAHLTAGHVGWIIATILLSVFCGFYLLRLSYAYMIFFITIMIGQLYTVLHTFSDGLLVLRLEETAVGAVAGIVVALLVTPLSTRDTVQVAETALLDALSRLLAAVADTVDGRPADPGASTDLDALSRALDDQARRLELVARPLSRPLVPGHPSRRTRHRVGLFRSTAVYARGLVVAVRRCVPLDPGQAAAVATAARALSLAAASPAGRDETVGRTAGSADADPLAAADGALFDDGAGDHDVARALLHLHDVLGELGLEQRPARPSPPDRVAA